MTLAEFDEKIRQLKVVMTSGLRNINIDISKSDLIELESIAEAFEKGRHEISEMNNLIDNVISIGGKIVSLII